MGRKAPSSYSRHFVRGLVVSGGAGARGFEPAKHYAEDLEPPPFDHSGTPAVARRYFTLDTRAS